MRCRVGLQCRGAARGWRWRGGKAHTRTAQRSRPFVEQPPAPPGLAAAPGAPRSPITCDALRALNFSSGLPLVIVDTGGQRISLEDTPATITTCNATGGAQEAQEARLGCRRRHEGAAGTSALPPCRRRR